MGRWRESGEINRQAWEAERKSPSESDTLTWIERETDKQTEVPT